MTQPTNRIRFYELAGRAVNFRSEDILESHTSTSSSSHTPSSGSTTTTSSSSSTTTQIRTGARASFTLRLDSASPKLPNQEQEEAFVTFKTDDDVPALEGQLIVVRAARTRNGEFMAQSVECDELGIKLLSSDNLLAFEEFSESTFYSVGYPIGGCVLGGILGFIVATINDSSSMNEVLYYAVAVTVIGMGLGWAIAKHQVQKMVELFGEG